MKTTANAFATILLLVHVTGVAETIITKQVESYYYSNGEMKRSDGQFVTTYVVDDRFVTRTKVLDIINNKAIPDDTKYRIEKYLSSDPANPRCCVFGNPVIRAYGQPGLDAIEILSIGAKYIQSTKSTSDYFVIDRQIRLESWP